MRPGLPTKEAVREHTEALEASWDALLAADRPEVVSLRYFVHTALKARIDAGECFVTAPHPLFSTPRQEVLDVCVDHTHFSGRAPYLLLTADGGCRHIFGECTLQVEWLEPPLKRCGKCGEDWPQTDEFFYRTSRKRGGSFRSPCKACIAEKKQHTNSTRPCCIPGCGQPRHRRKSGIYDHRCSSHAYYKMVKKARK